MDAHKHVTMRNFYSVTIAVPASTGSYASIRALAITALNATTDKEALNALKYRLGTWKMMKTSGGSSLTYTVRVGDTTSGVNASADEIAKNTDEELSSAEFPGDGTAIGDIFVISTGATFNCTLVWGACAGNTVARQNPDIV